MTFESEKFTKKLFLDELKKNIQLEKLLLLFSEYLDNIKDHKIMRYFLTRYHTKIQNKKINFKEEDIDVLVFCHSVWKYTQIMTDNISISNRKCNSQLSNDIMISITLYSAVYEVFKSKMTKFAEYLIKLYEDASLQINSPRRKSEESERLIKLRTIYYLDFKIPLDILGIDLDITEFDFLFYCLKKSGDKDLLKQWIEGSGIEYIKDEAIMRINNNENVLIREIMTMINLN